MFNRALIDADSIPWRIAPVVENESETFVIDFTHEYMLTLFEDTKAESNILVFSWENRNEIFRKMLWEPYKKDRPTAKPRHFQLVTDNLKGTYGCTSRKYMEADDLLVVMKGEDDVLVTLDKDLLQVPGAYMNLRDRGINIIDEEQATRFFWTQMLCGDNIDNVRGLTQRQVGTANSDRFIGESGAKKIIDKVDINDLEEFVRDLYPDLNHFNLNFNLLRMWRKPYELYIDGGVMAIDTQEKFLEELAKLKKMFEELAGRKPDEEKG